MARFFDSRNDQAYTLATNDQIYFCLAETECWKVTADLACNDSGSAGTCWVLTNGATTAAPSATVPAIDETLTATVGTDGIELGLDGNAVAANPGYVLVKDDMDSWGTVMGFDAMRWLLTSEEASFVDQDITVWAGWGVDSGTAANVSTGITLTSVDRVAAAFAATMFSSIGALAVATVAVTF